ncbi:hypothetical protein OHAE_1913 [Ochrobactrum soli]|uniref:Uncharacterized protein n=1 Tax=Ochrobactrum soli TaxID=2448455 RepID=A0A2P9HPH8_9HYPH|nr:hypothetical protein OHAE_1913 [[Ochrobactrum] soli]
MMFAAVETVAKADPIGTPRGDKPDIATQTATSKLIHGFPPQFNRIMLFRRNI